MRGTAMFLNGLAPSKTAGMWWRPSMPGTIKRLTSSDETGLEEGPVDVTASFEQ
jgi:hypothetical protein